MDLLELVKKLSARGYDARYFDTGAEAVSTVLEIIGSAETGFGGSVTIDSLGIYERLVQNGNKAHWHWKNADKKAAHLLAAKSEFYLCSANAVTESGQIINVDGTGNRVAATIFGPENVIMIIGRNKICKDYDAAINRIKTVACPKNAARLGLPTPCASTNGCVDCNSASRMCHVTTIHERKPNAIGNFYVFIVNEDLGY